MGRPDVATSWSRRPGWPTRGPRAGRARSGAGRSAPATRRSSSTTACLFTMYRTGNGRRAVRARGTRRSRWSRSTRPRARRSGSTRIRRRSRTSASVAGPHSTPLIVGDRLFTIGTNKQLFAFDKKTGKVIWSHDLDRRVRRAVAAHPARRQGRLRLQSDRLSRHDHLLRGRSRPVGDRVPSDRRQRRVEERHFLVSETAPILITFRGREQLVIVGGGTVNGLDPVERADALVAPARSRQRPEHATRRCGAATTSCSSRRRTRAGSRALQADAARRPRRTPRSSGSSPACGYMFLNALRLGDYVYGTSRRSRPVVPHRDEHQDRPDGVAASRHRPRQHGLCRRQGDPARRRRRPHSREAGAGRRHGARAGEALRHDVLDGADAVWRHAVRPRPGKDRRARRRRAGDDSAERPRLRRAGSQLRQPASAPANPISGTWKLDQRTQHHRLSDAAWI